MSQTHAIDKNSSLRVLPLPGRQDTSAVGGASQHAQQTKTAPQPGDALAVAGRSQQADNFLYVSYGPISLAQAANLQLFAPRAAFASGRQPLADHVVNYLLHNNETATDDAPAPNGSTAVAGRYQSAANGFPRRSDSLFSFVG
ncbi:MAG: hypothetical protein ABL897_12115 [Hyphomicrobium sp.]